MSTIEPYLTCSGSARPGAAIFLSGGGSNARILLQKWRLAGEQAPFTVTAIVTDAPEQSAARQLAAEFNLPLVAEDIRAFYRERGQNRVSIATAAGQQIRQQWTQALRQKLQAYRVDFAVLAGFVPLTNLTGDFPCLNIHPGDLTYLKDGERYLVGLHTIPVERAILEDLEYLRSSVILALPYTDSGKDMDNGPILGLSPAVEIDLGSHSLEYLRQIAAARPAKRPAGGFADELETLAEHNQLRLKERGDWVVLPPAVFDFARGRFGHDTDGALFYRLGQKWHPVETVIYDAAEREVVFRMPTE